jgi:hypothetical protein
MSTIIITVSGGTTVQIMSDLPPDKVVLNISTKPTIQVINDAPIEQTRIKSSTQVTDTILNKDFIPFSTEENKIVSTQSISQVEESESKSTVQVEESKSTVQVEESESKSTVQVEESESKSTVQVEELKSKSTVQVEESKLHKKTQPIVEFRSINVADSKKSPIVNSITPKRSRDYDDFFEQLSTKRTEVEPVKELDDFLEHVKHLIQAKHQYIHDLVDSIRINGNIHVFNIYIRIPPYMASKTEDIYIYYASKDFKRIIINYVYNIIKDDTILFVSFLNENEHTFKLRFVKNNYYVS